MTQFKRQATVTIGPPGEGGLKISGLRVSFRIVKDDDKDPNEASIDIYNMSEESRRKIDSVDSLLYLDAGYVDGTGIETLFVGNITDITHHITPPDISTKIIVNDGSKDLQDKRMSLSFESGISGREVLRQILNSFSMGNNFKDISIPGIKYANGVSFSGSSRNALTKATSFLGLNWSIQNNEIKLVQFDGDDGSRAVLLSPDTGMIGSPEKISFKTRNYKGLSKKDDIPGWRITSLLQPQLVPASKVVINSKELTTENSLFSVMSVSHSGDTHGSEWHSIIEVKE